MSALYSCRLDFCLFFIFRSRQAGIVSTVLSVRVGAKNDDGAMRVAFFHACKKTATSCKMKYGTKTTVLYSS
jgi:hypothetical protein